MEPLALTFGRSVMTWHGPCDGHSGTRCEGINVLLCDGEVAFQTVFHFHLHVIPRYAGDGWTLKAESPERKRSLLDSDAQTIKDAIASTDWLATSAHAALRAGYARPDLPGSARHLRAPTARRCERGPVDCSAAVDHTPIRRRWLNGGVRAAESP